MTSRLCSMLMEQDITFTLPFDINTTKESHVQEGCIVFKKESIDSLLID